MEVRRRDRGARLRALTAAAYTATAGHLEIEPEDDVVPARRRWSTTARSAAVAGAVVLLCALVVVAGAWLGRPGDPVPLPPPGAAAAEDEVEPAVHGDEDTAPAPDVATEASPTARGGPGPTASPAVVVHVAGAVQAPGVVELAGGARVGQAVEAAGGAAGDADLAAVNLARVLVDGEQIYVPRQGEQPPGPAAGPPGAAGPAGAPAPDGAGGDDGGGPVNLNTATAAELDELPGVGPAIAQRILEWRELNGGFTSVDDLDEVSGIGPTTLERLRPLVTL